MGSYSGTAGGGASRCRVVECTLVDGGVPEYYIGVKCYEALGGGDCSTEGANARDVTSVAEWLAKVGSRSGSPGVVDNGPVKAATTDQTLRKLQENDPEFHKYDDKPENFLP